MLKNYQSLIGSILGVIGAISIALIMFYINSRYEKKKEKKQIYTTVLARFILIENYCPIFEDIEQTISEIKSSSKENEEDLIEYTQVKNRIVEQGHAVIRSFSEELIKFETLYPQKNSGVIFYLFIANLESYSVLMDLCTNDFINIVKVWRRYLEEQPELQKMYQNIHIPKIVISEDSTN